MSAALNLNVYLIAVNFLCTFPYLICLAESRIFLAESPIASFTQDDSGDQSRNVISFCNQKILNFLPPPYRRQHGFGCSHAGSSIYFKFQQDNDSVTTIILSRDKFSGWLGIGFSKDGGMVGSSAVVGWSGEHTTAMGKTVHVPPGIANFYLLGKEIDQVKCFKHDLGLFNFTDAPPFIVTYNNLFYMGFQAKFGAPLGQQYLILATGADQPHISSNFSQIRLTKHTDQAVLLVDFSSGYAPSESNSIGVKKMRHGVVAIIGWGTVLPFGAIIARYFKSHAPQWFYLHMSIQFVGFLLGLSAFLLGCEVYDKVDPYRQSNVNAHRFIGISVLLVSILQVMALILRPRKRSKWRKYWNWYHQWLGRLTILLGAVNIVIGIWVGKSGPAWKIGYGFIIAFILVTVTCLEASTGLGRSKKSDTVSVFGND